MADGPALMCLEDLCMMLECSPKTIFRRVRRGQLPPPARYSRNYAGWNLNDVSLYLMSDSDIDEELNAIAEELKRMESEKGKKDFPTPTDACEWRDYLAGRRRCLVQRQEQMNKRKRK